MGVGDGNGGMGVWGLEQSVLWLSVFREYFSKFIGAWEWECGDGVGMGV